MILTDDEIEFVTQLAIRAGKKAHAMQELTVSEKTGPNDRVTNADIELSEMIVAALSERFPGYVVVSEEDQNFPQPSFADRIWMVDPIDGTDNYIRTRSQYSVMVGLLVDGAPKFGFVYAPAKNVCYFGGPEFGAWRRVGDSIERIPSARDLASGKSRRLMMGSRDRKRHPWVESLENVQFVYSGSVGLKVAYILENHADMFIHLSGKLKAWDTAGPCAIALAGGLEAGTLEQDVLNFELPSVYHNSSIIIGRQGSLDWCRDHLNQPA
ncbi:MAG: inositol monophosphatase family protein [Cyanobacteria bacterium]|nr:inositol monophosphatase family protein [Cyanobacteriota bacterium]